MTEPTVMINAFICDQAEWQQINLNTFRKLIHKVDPAVEEDWKWSVPVFVSGGKMICAMSVFTAHTKFNFFTGAKLSDPDKLFNSGLDSKQHRSINLHETESIDWTKLEHLIREACGK